MAIRIVRPDTAFSYDLSSSATKRPRVKNDGHLAFIRKLPCLLTLKRGVDAAHVRYGDPRFGKPQTPYGVKPHDRWTIPLHRTVHTEQHSENEREFWKRHGIDPVEVAAALWANTGDEEAAEMLIQVRWHGRAKA